MTDCKTAQQTDAVLRQIEAAVEELIKWADADAAHAKANGAPGVAREDARRAARLRRVKSILLTCYQGD